MKSLNPRTILWMVFVTSLFLLWTNYQAHLAKNAPPVPTQAAQSTATNSANTQNVHAANPSVAPASTELSGQIIVLENDVLQLQINTQGGVAQFAMLKKYVNPHNNALNTVLFNSKTTNPAVQSANEIYFARSGLMGMGLDHTTLFTASAATATLNDGQDAVSVTLTAQKDGVTLNKTYTLKRGSYLMDVKNEVVNASAQVVKPDVYMDLVRDGSQVGDSKFYTTYTGPVIYNEKDKFNKVDFTKIDQGKAEFIAQSPSGWIGMVQHYFVSAWVVPEKLERTFYTDVLKKTNNPMDSVYRVAERVSMGEIAPNATGQLTTQLYVGPQDQAVLANIAEGLELSVDYGWATVIAKPLHWFLSFLHSFIPNWGWTIVALTIIVKLAFFPLTAASYKSMAKMRQLAPKVKILQEQFGDDRAKLSQETMALYKAEKVNPAGGCLPMLVQMPVFLALFYVLQSAVEMRGAPWMGWIHDLSLPDPLYVLPVLMCATMVLQTWLNPKPADPMQEKMMWIMPFMFAFTFFFFPSGLVLYWVVSNIFSIGQQWVVTKKYGR